MQLEPKRIDVGKGYIQAGGKKIYLLDRISAYRFQRLEEMKLRMQFGAELPKFNQSLKEAWKDLNGLNFANAAVKINKLIQAADEQIRLNGSHPLLLIGTIFLAVDGDDVATWSEAKANETLELIFNEGYDYEDFFLLSKQKMLDYAERLNRPGEQEREG